MEQLIARRWLQIMLVCGDGMQVEAYTRIKQKPKSMSCLVSYIVGFYKSKRLNSVLGNLPLAIFKRKMAAKQPIAVSRNT